MSRGRKLNIERDRRTFTSPPQVLALLSPAPCEMLGAIVGGYTKQAYIIISTRTSFSALTWCVPLCWVRGKMPALFQQTRRQAPPWPDSWGSKLCHRSQHASSTEILQVITKCLCSIFLQSVLSSVNLEKNLPCSSPAPSISLSVLTSAGVLVVWGSKGQSDGHIHIFLPLANQQQSSHQEKHPNIHVTIITADGIPAPQQELL